MPKSGNYKGKSVKVVPKIQSEAAREQTEGMHGAVGAALVSTVRKQSGDAMAHQVFDGLSVPLQVDMMENQMATGVASHVGISSSVSCSLGDNDSEEEALESESESKEDQVLDKMPKGGSNTSRPWNALFRDNRRIDKGILLETIDSDDELVLLDDDDMDEVEEAWGFCLVGYFAGKFPGREAVHRICRAWNVRYSFFIHHSGWLIFKFQSEEDGFGVLNGGPHFIFGRPLLLKVMQRCFDFGDEGIGVVLVWVNLPGLPLDCWNAKCLSKIVSRVGKPIASDKLTLTKERISYARVLVEIDAAKDLVRSVCLKLPTGTIREQPIFFEYEPKLCMGCHCFGHTTDACKGAADEAQKMAKEVPVHMGARQGFQKMGDAMPAASKWAARQQTAAADRQQRAATARQQPAAVARQQTAAKGQQGATTDWQQPATSGGQQGAAADRQQFAADARQRSAATDKQRSAAVGDPSTPTTEEVTSDSDNASTAGSVGSEACEAVDGASASEMGLGAASNEDMGAGREAGQKVAGKELIFYDVASDGSLRELDADTCAARGYGRLLKGGVLYTSGSDGLPLELEENDEVMEKVRRANPWAGERLDATNRVQRSAAMDGMVTTSALEDAQRDVEFPPFEKVVTRSMKKAARAKDGKASAGDASRGGRKGMSSPLHH